MGQALPTNRSHEKLRAQARSHTKARSDQLAENRCAGNPYPERGAQIGQEEIDHDPRHPVAPPARSEEHTSELQSLMRISYAVFCLKKKKNDIKRLYNVRHK